MINVRRNELNWRIRRSSMISAAIGTFSAIDWLASTEVSSSPPNS